MTSVGAQIEADEIGYWFHITDPLGNWSVYEVLTDGLITVKRERHEALARHDHVRADQLLAEIVDLTALCAACAEGIARQRARFLNSDRPWPLTRISG